jgi:hypothetical protein
MLGRPTLAILFTLSMVLVTVRRPNPTTWHTVVLVLQSAFFGAAVLWLLQSLDASGYTHFGRWFNGH